jgi:multiple sugar transport system substrate-binding protein
MHHQEKTNVKRQRKIHYRSKGLHVLLAAVLMFTLTACGSSKSTSGGSGASGGNAGQEGGSATTGTVTIEFWYGLGGALGEKMEALIERFNSSQDEVIVKSVVQGNYDETAQKLQASIAAGNPPAVALTWPPNHEWARRGYYMALDDFIANDPDFNKDDVIEAFRLQGEVDGKQYFLPMYGTTQVMYYRKDTFEQHGIKPEDLTTWEKLAEAAAKMAVKENGETVFYGWEPMYDHNNLIDAAFSRGAKYLSDDGKTILFDQPEWVETWEMFRKWIHDDKIMRIHYGGQGWEYWYRTIDDVMQGRAAGYTGSSGDQGDLDFTIIGAFEQPGWEGHTPGKPVALAITAAILAGAKPEQQEAAFKWLKFFMSPAITAEWSIQTGYIPVRKSAEDDPAFAAYVKDNPQALVPLRQAAHASAPFLDPTGGKITDALKIAADKLEIANEPAEKVLKEAKEEAQKAWDEYLAKNR